MFFEKTSQISQIASKIGCSIFVISGDTPLKLRSALYLQPDTSKKTQTISVDQVRDFCAAASHKESTECYFVITPADCMNEAAQNAFLKTLEEPKPHTHFILLTEKPLSLLPTILSRSQIFYLRQLNLLDQPPHYSKKVMDYAKQLIAATPADLPNLADKISKTKDQPRVLACDITSAAIEILYKTYFKTKNEKFLAKIAKFIKLYDGLENNGHIKLHIVADLL